MNQGLLDKLITPEKSNMVIATENKANIPISSSYVLCAYFKPHNPPNKANHLLYYQGFILIFGERDCITNMSLVPLIGHPMDIGNTPKQSRKINISKPLIHHLQLFIYLVPTITIPALHAYNNVNYTLF